MVSEKLGANLFRITQTDAILNKNNIDNENNACITYHKVGRSVRQAIKKLGDTMLEELPTSKYHN